LLKINEKRQFLKNRLFKDRQHESVAVTLLMSVRQPGINKAFIAVM